MTDRYAIAGARIFDGETWHDDAALLVAGDSVQGIVPLRDLDAGIGRVAADGGLLVPGFVDLQVNGGGGVMMNNRPDVDTIRTICAAYAPSGTTALLVTLVADSPETWATTVTAARDALDQRVPGFLGLHMEGPHLAVSRRGAHDPDEIRPMSDEDETRLISARRDVPVLLVTVAPETVGPERIRALSNAGIVVSLGHSDTTYRMAADAAAAGASMVTHLFNAMSQLSNREPGLVGAGIDIGAFNCGLIADGIHVDAASIAVALRGKRGPGKIFLVSDGMATIGTDLTSFTLHGRTIYRKDGRLTLADGTLAGADLDMISAVRFMHRTIGVTLDEALRMASLYPAQAMRVDSRHGRLRRQAAADILHLDDDLNVRSVWIGGKQVVQA